MTNSEVLEEPAQHKLRIYSYASIGIATLLGGPIATAYMLAKNYRVFSMPDAIIVTWPVAVIIEIGIIISFVAIPEVTNLSIAVPLIYTITALILTKVLQGRQIAKYYADGGGVFTYSKGMRIGLAILAVTLVILFAALIMMLAIGGGVC